MMIVVDRKTGEVLGGPFATAEELRGWMRERLANRLPIGVVRRADSGSAG